MTVVYSDCPDSNGLSALKLERNGAQSKKTGSALDVSGGGSEDVEGTTAGVVVLLYARLICLKGWKPGRSSY